MLGIAVVVMSALVAGWFVLLYRFHLTLDGIDPKLSGEIGRPSLFWTAFNGHAHLVRLMRRPDLAQTIYAPLARQARVLRVWAVAMLASIGWVLWEFARAPGV